VVPGYPRVRSSVVKNSSGEEIDFRSMRFLDAVGHEFTSPLAERQASCDAHVELAVLLLSMTDDGDLSPGPMLSSEGLFLCDARAIDSSLVDDFLATDFPADADSSRCRHGSWELR